MSIYSQCNIRQKRKLFRVRCIIVWEIDVWIKDGVRIRKAVFCLKFSAIVNLALLYMAFCKIFECYCKRTIRHSGFEPQTQHQFFTAFSRFLCRIYIIVGIPNHFIPRSFKFPAFNSWEHLDNRQLDCMSSLLKISPFMYNMVQLSVIHFKSLI